MARLTTPPFEQTLPALAARKRNRAERLERQAKQARSEADELDRQWQQYRAEHWPRK